MVDLHADDRVSALDIVGVILRMTGLAHLLVEEVCDVGLVASRCDAANIQTSGLSGISDARWEVVLETAKGGHGIETTVSTSTNGRRQVRPVLTWQIEAAAHLGLQRSDVLHTRRLDVPASSRTLALRNGHGVFWCGAASARAKGTRLIGSRAAATTTAATSAAATEVSVCWTVAATVIGAIVASGGRGRVVAAGVRAAIIIVVARRTLSVASGGTYMSSRSLDQFQRRRNTHLSSYLINSPGSKAGKSGMHQMGEPGA